MIYMYIDMGEVDNGREVRSVLLTEYDSKICGFLGVLYVREDDDGENIDL